jgi:hypothetical protein
MDVEFCLITADNDVAYRRDHNYRYTVCDTLAAAAITKFNKPIYNNFLVGTKVQLLFPTLVTKV